MATLGNIEPMGGVEQTKRTNKNGTGLGFREWFHVHVNNTSFFVFLRRRSEKGKINKSSLHLFSLFPFQHNRWPLALWSDCCPLAVHCLMQILQLYRHTHVGPGGSLKISPTLCCRDLPAGSRVYWHCEGYHSGSLFWLTKGKRRACFERKKYMVKLICQSC